MLENIMKINICKNCNEPVTGNFCSHCGQPAKLKRIDGQYVISEIGDFFLANRGMVYTIKNVLISPGKSVRQFISENRFHFVKPVTFLFITALFYALISNFFDIHTSMIYQGPEGIVKFVMYWLIEHPGYMHIIVGFFLAFWIKIFFRKSGYNLFEIYVLFCFAFGITTLFHSLVMIIQGITHWDLINFSGFMGAVYVAWAIGQFFDGKKASSYIKAFLSYILGFLTFGTLVAVSAWIEIAI